MNRQLYDKLVDIINSNKLNLTRKELYDYIINNGDLLVCGNKSMNASYFNWFERDNVMLRDISKCAL